MTQSEKRIKIAEACGWTECGYYGDESHCTLSGITSNGGRHSLPDYFTDLDAMHEAEQQAKIFHNNEQFDRWCVNLFHCVRSLCLSGTTSRPLNRAIADSSASQRAEAFGLTLNLWKEGE